MYYQRLVSFFIIGITFALVLNSCSLKESYEFQVVNKTEFNIDLFEFDDEAFEVPPQGESEVFSETLVYNCFCFTEPLVPIGVRVFSDSTDTYEHSIGQVLSPARRSKSGKNILRVTLADSIDFPNRVFRIEYDP